jgi:hypothetical protein
MRILAFAILTIGMVSAVPSTLAQTYDPHYPVCLQVSSHTGSYIECSYTSRAQCAQSASGRSAHCIVNPYYAGATASSGRHRRYHRAY